MTSGRWRNAQRSATSRPTQGRELADHPEDGDLLGWLGLMRHYGAPTRLLDWTMSPFVACYFAYESLTDTHDGALWGLEAFYCRLVSVPTTTFPFDAAGTWPSGDPPRFLAVDRTRSEAENSLLRTHMRTKSAWPMPLVPNWIDARMAAQQAVFTAVGDLKRSVDHLWQPATDPQHSTKLAGLNSIKSYVTKQRLQRLGLPTSGVLREDQIIRKVILPSAWRADALDTLDRMGINRRSLFPGLDGLGAGTAEHLSRQTSRLRDLLSPMLHEADFPHDQ